MSEPPRRTSIGWLYPATHCAHADPNAKRNLGEIIGDPIARLASAGSLDPSHVILAELLRDRG